MKLPIKDDEYVISANKKNDKNLFFSMIILYSKL